MWGDNSTCSGCGVCPAEGDILANDDCGVCGGQCTGCTDSAACNYDVSATIDDGSCILDSEDLTIIILTDNYPGETTWTVTDVARARLWHLVDLTYGRHEYVEQVCIDAGCYTFTISDSFGDGVCCAYGIGSYAVSTNGTELASGGEFATSEATDFCLGSDFGLHRSYRLQLRRCRGDRRWFMRLYLLRLHGS